MRVVRDPGLLPERCVLVPTMGALHAGHLSLVRIARDRAGGNLPVVVSIFVNPTQFNDARDLEAYPRDLDRDVHLCAQTGADIVFAPDVETVYPPGVKTPSPKLPAVAVQPGLEDAGRPGHFAGVCQVVTRLFALCRPVAAVFGEKDWQQLQVVRALVQAERSSVQIIAGPIVRERDGLAMSSRNVRLSGDDRIKALSLRRSLDAAQRASTPEQAEQAMHAVLDVPGVDVQYAVVRDAERLEPLRDTRRAVGRALVCACVSGVRLLDNDAWIGPDIR